MTFASTGARQKPELDENSFQQLLAAAYTMQEHKAGVQVKRLPRDPAKISSEIAITRKQALADDWDFASALALVSNCVRDLTNAEGASICLVNDGYLSCAASSGTAAKVPGGSVASNSLVATERLRNGRAFQSAKARSDIRLAPAMCVELQIGSLLAVPIERHNEVAGLLELRWNDADGFEELDERICELATGLIGELLAREYGPVSATAPVADCASTARQSRSRNSFDYAQGGLCLSQNGETRMEQPIFKPIAMNLEELREESRHGVSPVPMPSSPVSEVSSGDGASHCRVCGHALNGKDDFCGNCGMLANPTDDGLQSKWASMWFMQRAQEAMKEESGQNQRERMWPLEEVRADKATPTLETQPSNLNHGEVQDTNENLEEIDELTAGAKRGPRSVLSVLKLHLKARGMARKLSAFIFLALLKKFP